MDSIGQGRPCGAIYCGERDSQVALEAIARFITPELIASSLQQTGRRSRRIRRLPAPAVTWLVIAMGLFSDLDTPGVWRQVVGTLRMLWSAAAGKRAPRKSAFSMARERLGPRPLRRLFVQTAGVLGTFATPGVFYRGLRTLALDAMSMDLPDTPANAKAFGHPGTHRAGEPTIGGFPRATLCVLQEAGTHAVLETLVRPCKCNEFAAGACLLKRVPPGCLVTWDRLYSSVKLLELAVARGVEVLGRLSSVQVFTPSETLGDGSFLAQMGPVRQGFGRQAGEVMVRVIVYIIDDPDRPGHGQVHRLVTTLLDEKRYPAMELVELYHQRWEIEIGNDEIKTHELASLRPTTLRSRTPRGVVQEIYGVLTAYNAVRRVMFEAAGTVNLDPRRMKFTDSLRIIREAIPHMRSAPLEQLPKMYNALLAQIAADPLPPRDNRINPRVVRRKMSNFLMKHPGDSKPRQPCRPFIESVKLLN